MEQLYTKEDNILEKEEKPNNAQAFSDLLELWTQVSLYIDTFYQSISQIPDRKLRYVYLYCNLNKLLKE